MRKMYTLLAGMILTLFATRSYALPVTPDVANFTVSVNDSTRLVLFTNTSTLGSEPGERTAVWIFGDGAVTVTPALANTQHIYPAPGTYNACLKIYRRNTAGDTVLSAMICKTLTIAQVCRADFEKLPPPAGGTFLTYFRALPWSNSQARPIRICWQFGDGHDTCINYTQSYTGQYLATHTYANGGNYQVCVTIGYYGGCTATKCKSVLIGRPDSCGADIERIPVNSNPLLNYFKALPSHNNNRKPSRVCWQFGDGHDTCINYAETFTGYYAVSHLYGQPGNYNVCVNIQYYGGCDHSTCRPYQIGRPDSCSADFERIQGAPTSLRQYFRALPSHNNNRKPSRICWQFGDGMDTCINYLENYTGQYVVAHNYAHTGNYNVCVNIQYFGGCQSSKCHNITVGVPDSCGADFERIVSTNANPLQVYLKALPFHNNNRKPSRVCWRFGDGSSDTCLNYAETYTGLYVVGHRYGAPGTYEVCVQITYYGGCVAYKCRNIIVTRPDSCAANFEKIPSPSSMPLQAYFRALPYHNNNRKPARICWQFGDGHDTCINYIESYTGQYVVSHRYAQAGTYTVCVNILYYGGCQAQNCSPVIIPPPQPVCMVGLVQIIPTQWSLARGFIATPVSGSNPPSRVIQVCWRFGDGRDTCINVDTTLPPVPNYAISHTYPAPGVYNACVRVVFANSCVAESCKEVAIRPPSNICGAYMTDSSMGQRTYRFSGFAVIPPQDHVTSYYWTFSDGTTATGQTVVHTFPQPGTYTACLIIHTALGCQATVCKTIVITTGNGSQLHLAPNPVQSTLYVEFISTHTEQVLVRILNNNGVVVRSYTRNVTVGQNLWSDAVSNLLPGLYSYVVQSPNQLASAIFIKQ
jgi:PKD repeat protein